MIDTDLHFQDALIELSTGEFTHAEWVLASSGVEIVSFKWVLGAERAARSITGRFRRRSH
jgi:hypothetical protein